MAPIRVLVVDDAIVIRKLLTTVLNQDPEIEVTETAENGRVALDCIERDKPDIVILDVEMPVMDGLETLRAIREEDSDLPVLIFSTHTDRGAAVTLKALSLGANDYVTKPGPSAGAARGVQHIKTEILPRIKLFCKREEPEEPPIPRTRVDTARLGRIDLLAIGVSTGGPNALAQVIPALPTGFPVPVLIVQHMPATFTRQLAASLNAKSNIPVAEAAQAEVIRPGNVYIAPGNFHMQIRRDGVELRVALNQNPPENSCRPAVDPLFRSAAKVYGDATLAVVLTGMGQDGAAGCVAIRRAGGQVLAQDEATSVVWGMPGTIARQGLADDVLPLEKITPEIVRRVRVGRPAWTPAVS